MSRLPPPSFLSFLPAPGSLSYSVGVVLIVLLQVTDPGQIGSAPLAEQPPVDLAQAVGDLCFSASSFWVVSTVAGTLVATISALFTFLMVSFKARIEAAELREKSAYTERDRAYDDRNIALEERNAALWRLSETTERYQDIIAEVDPLGRVERARTTRRKA